MCESLIPSNFFSLVRKIGKKSKKIGTITIAKAQFISLSWSQFILTFGRFLFHSDYFFKGVQPGVPGRAKPPRTRMVTL